MVWQAGAVEQASQPRVMTHEGPPVLLAGAGRPFRADLAEEREQLDRSHWPGCLLETAVHVPGIRQDPGTRFGEGEQDLGTRLRTLPAPGPEDHVQGTAHQLVACQRPER